MIKRIFSIFLLIFILFFLISNFIEAKIKCPEGLVPCDATTGCPCKLCHLFIMFDRIVKFLLIPTPTNGQVPIVPALAALMIAIGGFMYVMGYTGIAGGGPDNISRANSLFKAVVIGLLIVYGAWILVEAFFDVMGVMPLFRNWNIIQDCP